MWLKDGQCTGAIQTWVPNWEDDRRPARWWGLGSVGPSVRLSVGPSVHRSVRPSVRWLAFCCNPHSTKGWCSLHHGLQVFLVRDVCSQFQKHPWKCFALVVASYAFQSSCILSAGCAASWGAPSLRIHSDEPLYKLHRVCAVLTVIYHPVVARRVCKTFI